MTYEKEMKLLDPFFAHAAAIAATVHLYYCCAADARLRHKSKTDLAKCQQFLKQFCSFSPACDSLAQLLNKLIRTALRSDDMSFDWAPSRLEINIPLMWAVLKFDISSQKAVVSPSRGPLLPSSSNTPNDIIEDMQHTPTLEISVTATPPAVMIDPAQGHDARLPPYKATTSPGFPNDDIMRDIIVPPAESLMFGTPWLWTDASDFPNMADGGEFPSVPNVGNSSEGFSMW